MRATMRRQQDDGDGAEAEGLPEGTAVARGVDQDRGDQRAAEEAAEVARQEMFAAQER